MKKFAIFVMLISAFLLLSSMVSAISTGLVDSYQPWETVITKIAGNILEPVPAANVELRRGHILVPMDYEIKKLGDSYYLWFIAPEQKANYTLKIREITTYVSGSVQRVDYEKNFSVSGNLSDYYIRPGFVLTDRDFEIKAQLNEDNNREIELKFGGEDEQDYTLKPGENILKFYVTGVINETGLLNLSIGRYILPAYIQSNKTLTINLTNLSEISNVSDLTNIKPNTPQEEEAINKERTKYHCYEFPGKICAAGEVCSGESIVSLDGACCVNGNCGSAEKTGSSYAWIGYLLAALVIIGGVIIYIRYRKIKAEKNPLAKRIDLKDTP